MVVPLSILQKLLLIIPSFAHFGPETNATYKMEEKNITKSDEEKDLGIIIDGKLKFRQHINIQTKKANQKLGMIKRSFCNMDKGNGFLFRSEFFFRTTQDLEFFLSREARNFFPEFNISLYDKNSVSDFFFPPPISDYFFQQHWESEYIFF
jgi:hypothetical protein